MLISSIISVILFITYVVYILCRFKFIPTSLSKTYYLLGQGKWGYMFTLMMFTCAFLILPAMISITPEPIQFLSFLCPAAICFVGAAPNFLDDSDKWVHRISALIAAIAGLIWVASATAYWYIIPVALGLCTGLAYLTKSTRWSKKWWLEMVAFISVYFALLMTLI